MQIELSEETKNAIISMYGHSREELIETPDGDIYGWCVYNNSLDMCEIKEVLDNNGVVNLYYLVS